MYTQHKVYTTVMSFDPGTYILSVGVTTFYEEIPQCLNILSDIAHIYNICNKKVHNTLDQSIVYDYFYSSELYHIKRYLAKPKRGPDTTINRSPETLH